MTGNRREDQRRLTQERQGSRLDSHRRRQQGRLTQEREGRREHQTTVSGTLPHMSMNVPQGTPPLWEFSSTSISAHISFDKNSHPPADSSGQLPAESHSHPVDQG